MGKEEDQEKDNIIPFQKKEGHHKKKKQKKQPPSPLEVISKRARNRYLRHLDDIRRKSIDRVSDTPPASS